jgi:hypothetical protein
MKKKQRRRGEGEERERRGRGEGEEMERRGRGEGERKEIQPLKTKMNRARRMDGEKKRERV